MDLNNQDIGCSPQPDSKDVLLKTTPDSSLMTEKPVWCLPRTFTLLTSVHSTRSALHTIRGKREGWPSYKLWGHDGDLPA